MESKKKPFPKTKKKIRGFLTDESVNMSKKSALGLALGSVLLYTGVNNVNAGHSSTSTVTEYISPAIASPTNGATVTNYVYSSAATTCTSDSGGSGVNGHYSGVPAGMPTYGTPYAVTDTHTNSAARRVGRGGLIPAVNRVSETISPQVVPASLVPPPGPNGSTVNIANTTVYTPRAAGCSHSSGIVNGHYSQVNSIPGTPYTIVSNHASHGNHCSCSRWS